MLNHRWGFLSLAFILAGAAFAQNAVLTPAPPDSTQDATRIQPGTRGESSGLDSRTVRPGSDPSTQQPKRILGVMPNYRAVSAGAIPPPPTPMEAFKIATQNSFDYSSFLFTGLTSLEAEVSGTHPKLGTGMAGFGQYYWRGFLDKTDGN
ncbi:MAG: hypothetical protein ABSC08_13115, partial [Bryobacteraceae bacterium]